MAPILIPYIVVTLLWATFVQFDWTLPLVLALVNTFICVRQLTLAVVERGPGPIAITFWGFVLVWICVASLVQLSLHEMPWTDYGLEGLYGWAQAMLLVALLSYILGTGLAARQAQNSTSPPIPMAGVRPRIGALVTVGFALLILVLATTGGIAGRFQTRESVGNALGDSGLSDDTIALFVLNRLPAAIALVCGYLAARNLADTVATGRGGALPKTLMFILAALLVASLANPFSAPRYIAFSAIVGTLLGFVSLRSPKTKGLFAVLLVVGVLLVYPLATWFKKTTTQLGDRSIDLTTYTGIDFDGFQMMVNAIAYVDRSGYAYGEHILAAFAFFVPRSIWTTKPVPASFDVAASRGYAFQNLSLPIWAELYIDLGVVGMMVAMLVFGFVSRRLDLAYMSRPGTRAATIAILVAVAQFGVIRGPLGGSIVFFGTVLILGWLAVPHRPSIESGLPGRSLDSTTRNRNRGTVPARRLSAPASHLSETP